MRRKAWHILVGLDCMNDSACPQKSSSASLLDVKDLELIQCDAGRSVLFRYHKQQADDSTSLPSGESTSQHDLSYSDQQEQLASVLTETLAGKQLHYYQGLHDIAGVLLYNVQDAHHASAILSRLCRVHLRDALRQDLSSLISFLNAVLLPLLESVDVELHDFLLQSGLEVPNVVLPWIITWFTHDVHDERVASRLVDAFVSSHALFPL